MISVPNSSDFLVGTRRKDTDFGRETSENSGMSMQDGVSVKVILNFIRTLPHTHPSHTYAHPPRTNIFIKVFGH